MLYPLHWTLSLLATVLRLGAGGAPGRRKTADGQDLPVLYEFESCPHCRITREAVSAAGRSVLVMPCPKGGERFRPDVTEKGGKAQFPFLWDPAAGKGAYESRSLAREVLSKASTGRPIVHWLPVVNGILSSYASLARGMAGTFPQASTSPAKPLIYQGAERSPAGRLVKERLCALELPYIWQPSRIGPTLEDPNTGETLSGGATIRAYLRATYAV